MGHSSFAQAWAQAFAALAMAATPAGADQADSRHGFDQRHRPPVYQRRAFDWMRGHPHRRVDKGAHAAHWFSPPVNTGWFQRPYPYHLDYYRMRYGGSYAPYFGNLYGPPQVVTAPPYYGPYYGEYIQPGAGFNGGYGGPIGFPGHGGGVVNGGTSESSNPVNESAMPQGGESLPAPTE